MKHLNHKDMKHELEIQGYSDRTVSIYLKQVQNFAKFFNKPPDTLAHQHIHEYQVYLVHEKQVFWTCFNQTVCALRFF